MDLDRAAYETFDDLYPYCYRVASAVGLCSIAIFGYTRPARPGLRDQPRGGAPAHQYPPRRPDGRPHRPRLPAPGGPAALRRDRGGSPRGPLHARLRGADGLRGRRAPATTTRARGGACPTVDRRRLFAAEIMGHTYFALLRAIEARRFDVFGERVAVPTRRRVAIALAGWVRARLGARRSLPARRRRPLVRARRRTCRGLGEERALAPPRSNSHDARMRAQVFHGPGDLRLEELPVPDAGARRAGAEDGGARSPAAPT